MSKLLKSMDITIFILASGAILYPVWPFVVAAIRALRNGVLNMAVLVLLSVGTGYLFSVGSTFLYDGEQFYEAAAVLLVFILLGHWLEMRARAGASAAIRFSSAAISASSTSTVLRRRACSLSRAVLTCSSASAARALAASASIWAADSSSDF